MCSCQSLSSSTAGHIHGSVTRRLPKRPALAFVLGVLVAFFPKCPVCWAAYLTALGLTGSFQIPYPGYLYPLLFTMLALHLLSLIKRAAFVGWGPSLVSLCGAATLLAGHHWFPQHYWLLNLGILFVFGGSLWSSFATKQPPLREYSPVPTGKLRKPESATASKALR